MAFPSLEGRSCPSSNESSAAGNSFPRSRDILRLTAGARAKRTPADGLQALPGRLRAGRKIAREHHDRVAVGIAGAIFAVLRVDVDRARARQLTLRTADQLFRRHVPAVGPVPHGEEAGRVVLELLDEPAIGDHHLVTLGVELDLPGQ